MKTLFYATLALAAIASSGAHAQYSDNVIKIGVLNDQSGVYFDLAGKGSVVAAQMAVDDFGGKVGSTPIEIVVADHQNKPDVGSNIARQWFDVDHVECHRRRAQLGRRARGRAGGEGQEQGLLEQRRGHQRSDRQGLARPTPSTGPMTPSRSRAPPARPRSRRAARPGSSSSPTTPSARRSSAT